MDINALLEAFQDFEKRGKKETIPLLEQFLCHVAKTGQPLIPWTQFKPYFMFKLESIIDHFEASEPEQRPTHNPNVEFVPFEEMKERILKIVDGYNGIPFTIQRLCELLTDPKRNYSGTDKFLRGLEKNVLVVSCMWSITEKNGASTRMNGAMFPGNSLYSDSRSINGPRTPKALNRPRLSSSFSTNGLPEGVTSKESELATKKTEDHISDSAALSDGELSPNSRIKNKYPEDEGEEHCLDGHEVKRLKSENKEDDCESEEKKPSFCKRPESLSEALQSCTGEDTSDTSCETPAISEKEESYHIPTDKCEKQNDSSEPKAPQSEMPDSSVDQQEQDTVSETSIGSEQNDAKSKGEGLSTVEPVSFSNNSSDLTTDDDADSSNRTQTEIKPEEQD